MAKGSRLEGVTKSLSKNQKVGMTVAGLGFGLGAPLWIILAVVLAGLGVGIFLVLTMLPLVVAGVAFFGTFYLMNRVESLRVELPWNFVIPFVAAIAAWLVVWIPGVSGAIVSQVVSSSGVSAATAAAVEAQLLDVGGLLSAPAIIISIVSMVFAIVVIQALGSIPKIGNPIGAVFGVVVFVTLVLGVSLSGILPSAASAEGVTWEQTISSDGTTRVTFYFPDAAGNPTNVLVEIVGEEPQTTEGGFAVFQLNSRATARLQITDRYGTHTQSYYIEDEPQTIQVDGYTGFAEE